MGWDSDSEESSNSDEKPNHFARCPFNERLTRILIQLGLSLVVLGCMAGALAWSFNNGEKGTDNGNHQEHKRDASVNFTIFVDEWSKHGTYTVTKKSADGPNNNQHVEEHDSFWFQDDKNQRIVHRLDEKHTVYVRDKFAFYLEQEVIDGEVQSCKYFDSVNYTSYIQRTGLATLIKHYSEIERTKGHDQVFIYEGDPSTVSLLNYGDAVAFLITAYADSESGALLGWETYFEADGTDNYLYMASYWYEEMSPSTPSESRFSIPRECQTTFQMHHPEIGAEGAAGIEWKEYSLPLRTNRVSHFHSRKKHGGKRRRAHPRRKHRKHSHLGDLERTNG